MQGFTASQALPNKSLHFSFRVRRCTRLPVTLHVCNSHDSSQGNTISYCNLKPEVLARTCFCHQSQLKEPLRSSLHFPHTHVHKRAVEFHQTHEYYCFWGFLWSFLPSWMQKSEAEQNHPDTLCLHSRPLSVCTCCCLSLARICIAQVYQC